MTRTPFTSPKTYCMIKVFSVLVLLIALSKPIYSQEAIDENLLNSTFRTKSDSSKIMQLINSGARYLYTSPNASIPYLLKATEGSRIIDFAMGEVYATAMLAEALSFVGNFSKAVETGLQAVAEAEKLQDSTFISFVSEKMASIYNEAGDYWEAIRYSRKAVQGVYKFGLLGWSFALANQLDSGLYYSQLAYHLTVQQKSTWALPHFTLGRIHNKLGNHDLALNFYKTGLAIPPRIINLQDGNKLKVEVSTVDSLQCLLGIAETMMMLKKSDSCLSYARFIITFAEANNLPRFLGAAYKLVKEVYASTNQRDSAYLYQELMLRNNDTILAKSNVQQIQNLKFNEQLREMENEKAVQNGREQRNRNLQYAAIGTGLLTFLLIFVSLSNSFVVAASFIKFFGVVALLLVFEFTNLLLHPFISDVTHHSPIWMFLIMVIIAALLVPVHHNLEKWITHKLVEKNTRIRLAAARRTIATIEGV
jgi:tetratricopeptide (TPR) repeat protein